MNVSFDANDLLDPALQADDVSRWIARGEGLLLAVASASAWPFEQVFAPGSRAFLDRLAACWRPGALGESFGEAAAQWRREALPTLGDPDDPDCDPAVTAVAVEIDAEGARYACIGMDVAVVIRQGAIAARTPLDSMRVLHGLEGPPGDIVARALSRADDDQSPHTAAFPVQAGDEVVLVDAGAARRCPDLPFAADRAQAFREQHALPYVVRVCAPFSGAAGEPR